MNRISFSNLLSKKCLFFLVTFLFFSTVLIVRPVLFEDNQRVEERYSYDFDIDLITADMMLHRQSEGIALISSRLDKKQASEWVNNQQIKQEQIDNPPPFHILDYYAKGTVFPEHFFSDYSSNIVAHRLLHYLVQAISPLAPRYDLMLIIGMHALLSALAYTIICSWLRTIVGTLPVCIAIFTLSLSRAFYGYAAEVFFASWTLLFPICAIILLISTSYFKQASRRKQIVLLSAVSFIACSVKLACYFEFATTSMITMTLPIIYLIAQQKMRISLALQYFLYPTLAAIVAFVFIFSFKYALLSVHIGSLEEAYRITMDNLNARVTGNEQHYNQVIREAATRRLDLFIRGMFNIRIIEFSGITILSIWGCVFGCVYASAWNLYLLLKKHIFSHVSLMIVTWISFLAPLSWMVLAKPHAVAHYSIISPLWHFPTVLFASAFFFHSVHQQIKAFRMRKK